MFHDRYKLGTHAACPHMIGLYFIVVGLRLREHSRPMIFYDTQAYIPRLIIKCGLVTCEREKFEEDMMIQQGEDSICVI